MEELATVKELLPIENYDLTVEDEFVQAGQVLVEIGRKAFIGLGELLAWKVKRERADNEASRNRIIVRYASAWGVSRSNLTKALVTVARFPEVEKPKDTTPTVAYEVVSGSASAEEAEAVMERATKEGWSSTRLREAKMLMGKGLAEDWERPYLFHRDGMIWARLEDGRELWVAYLNPALRREVQSGVALLKYRARV